MTQKNKRKRFEENKTILNKKKVLFENSYITR